MGPNPLRVPPMESSDEVKGSHPKDCVKVAVNIRPLVASEHLLDCTDRVTVASGEPQVQIGSHVFTYDHVYGSSSTPVSAIFDECVLPLVDALFHGYNATVLAYGQTGSGKTYTMGTNYSTEANCGGIIPQVVETIFKKIDAMKDNTEFLVRVSFVEIFKEEVFDLLDYNLQPSLRVEGASSLAKPAIPARTSIQIRETANGGITLAGVIEAEVKTKDEMAFYLARGSSSRATGCTNMNSLASRSHAIFTILMEQRKTTNTNEIGNDILSAKFHLVDLAGSERAKRTGADGLRFKEGVHINKGLLALGNVISALGDEKKRKDGGHVPYRNSKLTRLLQDSLGGNTKTLMIACISPADTNAEETINTLKYANRARNIHNKAVVNRDPVTAEMQKLRSQLEQLQAELLYPRDSGALFEELQILRHKISLLEASNLELRQELKERQITCERLAQRALGAQVEKDMLILKIESARGGKSWEEIDKTDKMPELDISKAYIIKIQELEAELLHFQNLSNLDWHAFMDNLVLEKDAYLSSLCDLVPGSDGKIEEDEREREHSSLQDIMDKELQELDKRLEQKEVEMKHFATVGTSVMKQHYKKKLPEIGHEKKVLQKEIEDLRVSLASIASGSDDGAQKLTMLETQKQEEQSQLLRPKPKCDEAAKRLHEEIQRMKTQKVQLQHKIKQESEQFRSWKATREKEVLQLKKESRRNECELHKLLALNQRQKMVLQRKTEKATMVTKRLKELLETKEISISGAGNATGPAVQAIEHELEVTVRVHEVRSEYERQMKERTAMAEELVKLKEEAEKSKQGIMSDAMSPSARNSRMSALENMVATSSSMLVSMASQLSEAQELERASSGRGRWNQIQSLSEAKNIMDYLFNLVSSSRCESRDTEVSCREKESEMAELKENGVRLGSVVWKLEEQIAKLLQQNLQSGSGEEVHPYNLRKDPQTYMMISRSSVDTSDSEQSDSEYDLADEDWVESGKKMTRKRSNKQTARFSKSNSEDPSSFAENCTCSRLSLCRTKKCECHFAGSMCGASCGCVPSKCANRKKEEKHADLVSHGAILLQSVLAKPPLRDAKLRKPLADIKNTVWFDIPVQAGSTCRMAKAPPRDAKLQKPLADVENTVWFDIPVQAADPLAELAEGNY